MSYSQMSGYYFKTYFSHDLTLPSTWVTPLPLLPSSEKAEDKIHPVKKNVLG
jgi:hypothetical protein